MRQILAKVLALVGLCGIFVVSWNCKTILGVTERSFVALSCDPVDLDFGEVYLGNVAEMTFVAQNPSIFGEPDAYEDWYYSNPPSRVRLSGFSTADCGPSHVPFNVAGTFPVELEKDESSQLTVQFSPTNTGNWDCELEPQYEVLSIEVSATVQPHEISSTCSVHLSGSAVAAPEPPVSGVWSDCSKAGFDYDLNGLFGLAEDDIYLAGALGNVLRSSGACDWELAGTPFGEVNLTDIWAHSTASDTAIWAVGNLASNSTTGAILQSDGSTWEKVDEGWMVHYGAVWGSALDDVYFVGTGVSTDLANTKYWNGSVIDTLSIDMGWSELTSVHGTASDDVWAVLQQSLMSNSVYRFQGTNWENQTLPFTPSPLHDVWAVQGTDFYAVYAVGEDGAIYYYDGNSWSDESIAGETDDFYGVWVSETGQVWVVGQNGTIYHKSGTGWALQNTPTGLARDLRDVWGSSDEDVYAVGADGLILRFAR